MSRYIIDSSPNVVGNLQYSRDNWVYPYGKSLYKTYIVCMKMGYNPQESQKNTINTMGTLRRVHPKLPFDNLHRMQHHSICRFWLLPKKTSVSLRSLQRTAKLINLNRVSKLRSCVRPSKYQVWRRHRVTH